MRGIIVRASMWIYLMITVAFSSPGFLQGLVTDTDEAIGVLKRHPGSAGTWAESDGFFTQDECRIGKRMAGPDAVDRRKRQMTDEMDRVKDHVPDYGWYTWASAPGGCLPPVNRRV